METKIGNKMESGQTVLLAVRNTFGIVASYKVVEIIELFLSVAIVQHNGKKFRVMRTDLR